MTKKTRVFGFTVPVSFSYLPGDLPVERTTINNKKTVQCVDLKGQLHDIFTVVFWPE
jgi:hypothetical protein